MGSPDALHGSLADALALGHGSGTPMGCSGGLSLRGGLDNLLDPLGVIRHRSAPAGRDLGEVLGAALPEAIPPHDNRGATHAHLLSDLGVGQAIGGQKGNSGSPGNALRSLLATDPGLQGALLIGGHRERSSWSSHAATIPHFPQFRQAI